MTKYEVLLYGFIIAVVVIVIWIYYAYNYRTSLTRLSRMAGQRYMMLVSPETQAQYVVQCDPSLSAYDTVNQIFTAVIKFTPDIDHPTAPKIQNVSKKYSIVFDAVNCNPSDLAQYISCLNVNE